MSDVSPVLRLWLLGTGWGVACGIVSAWLVALIVSWSGCGDNFFISFAFIAYIGSFYGAAVGFVLGCPTGLLAGLVLAAVLRPAEPGAAVQKTVVLVLLGQLIAEAAFLGVPDRSRVWAYLVVPAITAIPLTLATRRVARDVSTDSATHRDTLAA
ncbi:MAG: hypothetical protein JWR83_1308 [Aeromicrobium sp.]|nr:hypothetical protein [Aeromicrobium sp.]